MEDRTLCPEKRGLRIFRLEAGCEDREDWLDRLWELDREIFPNSPWGREAFQKNTENRFRRPSGRWCSSTVERSMPRMDIRWYLVRTTV